MLTLKMSLLYYGMLPMNNYPIDIHQYDLDPRSPFYIEPPTCGATLIGARQSTESHV